MHHDRSIFALLAVASLASCARTPRPDEVASPSSSGGDAWQDLAYFSGPRASGRPLRLLTSLDERMPVEVLGLVEVQEPSGREDRGLADLEQRAEMRGADAVVDVAVRPEAPGTAAVDFVGVAVREADLVHGRAYETVGEIDVEAASMHDDDATAELQRRAAELHADVVLHVRLEHDDGARPLHLRGTAIRFRTSS